MLQEPKRPNLERLIGEANVHSQHRHFHFFVRCTLPPGVYLSVHVCTCVWERHWGEGGGIKRESGGGGEIKERERETERELGSHSWTDRLDAELFLDSCLSGAQLLKAQLRNTHVALHWRGLHLRNIYCSDGFFGLYESGRRDELFTGTPLPPPPSLISRMWLLWTMKERIRGRG